MVQVGEEPSSFGPTSGVLPSSDVGGGGEGWIGWLGTFSGLHFIFWPGQKPAVFWLDMEEWRGRLNELESGENVWILVVHVGSVNILKISG